MKTTGNTILVTGGGSGIGQALAHRWSDAGNQVIVTGRRQSALDDTIAGRNDMTAYVLDIDDPSAIRDFAASVIVDHPDLNVLVNNAGIMRSEDLTARRDLADAEAMVVTNLLGPIRLIDSLTDHLATKEDAAIVTVTSGLAFVPLPGAAIYSATKAAMHSYTQSLRARLSGRIEVIELAPPGVQTGLTPGQSSRPGYMPLDLYIDEVMNLFAQQPTPAEILVDNVKPLRFADREGKQEELLAMMAAR